MSSGSGNPDAPAGWYPIGDGSQRYWDGSQWTEHVAPAPAYPPPGGSPVPYRPQPPMSPSDDVTNDDRAMALLAHLLSLVGGWLGPLIVWLARRDQSTFVDHHGKEALNFQISMMIYWVVTFIASLLLIGLLFIPVLLVLHVLFPILAAVAANRGELYRYPLSIRLIS